jgi:hypothetical protein
MTATADKMALKVAFGKVPSFVTRESLGDYF